MNFFNNNKILVKITGLIFICLLTCSAASADSVQLEIDVAPKVINLKNESLVVTVHTNVAYNYVGTCMILFNGTVIETIRDKADLLGNYVAKFAMSDVKYFLVPNQSNSLTIQITTIDNNELSDSQDIFVIEVKQKGK